MVFSLDFGTLVTYIQGHEPRWWQFNYSVTMRGFVPEHDIYTTHVSLTRLEVEMNWKHDLPMRLFVDKL